MERLLAGEGGGAPRLRLDLGCGANGHQAAANCHIGNASSSRGHGIGEVDTEEDLRVLRVGVVNDAQHGLLADGVSDLAKRGKWRR